MHGNLSDVPLTNAGTSGSLMDRIRVVTRRTSSRSASWLCCHSAADTFAIMFTSLFVGQREVGAAMTVVANRVYTHRQRSAPYPALRSCQSSGHPRKPPVRSSHTHYRRPRSADLLRADGSICITGTRRAVINLLSWQVGGCPIPAGWPAVPGSVTAAERCSASSLRAPERFVVHSSKAWAWASVELLSCIFNCG
jgi:hypothetical protein